MASQFDELRKRYAAGRMPTPSDASTLFKQPSSGLPFLDRAQESAGRQANEYDAYQKYGPTGPVTLSGVAPRMSARTPSSVAVSDTQRAQTYADRVKSPYFVPQPKPQAFDGGIRVAGGVNADTAPIEPYKPRMAMNKFGDEVSDAVVTRPGGVMRRYSPEQVAAITDNPNAGAWRKPVSQMVIGGTSAAQNAVNDARRQAFMDKTTAPSGETYQGMLARWSAQNGPQGTMKQQEAAATRATQERVARIRAEGESGKITAERDAAIALEKQKGANQLADRNAANQGALAEANVKAAADLAGVKVRYADGLANKADIAKAYAAIAEKQAMAEGADRAKFDAALDTLMGYLTQKPTAQGGEELLTFTPEQAANLPSGTKFRTTDGRIMTKA